MSDVNIKSGNQQESLVNIKSGNQQESLLKGKEMKLKVTDFSTDFPDPTWKSDNIYVVKVKESSRTEATITAEDIGEAVISVTAKEGEKIYTAKCRVVVGTIFLNQSELSIKLDESKTIEATVLDGDSVTWTSEDERIAAVEYNEKDTTKATIQPKAPGVTTITAKIDGTTYTATCKVTVDSYISLDSSAFSFDVGEIQTIKATVPEDNTPITWEIKIAESKDPESKATNVEIVSEDSTAKTATIKAKAPGEAVVTARITCDKKDYSATCTVTVNPPRLNRDKLTLLIGNKFQLEVFPSIPSDSSVTWSSSVEGVVTVDNGLVTAKSEGTAEVTATMSINGTNYSATCSVTVEDKMQDVLVNWANERFDPYKDSEEKYSFRFTPKSKTDELTLVQGEEKQCLIKDENKQNKIDAVVSFVLTEVSFHKEIYQPGYVEVVIKTDASLSLFEGWTSLEYKGKEGEITIAKNYYIFEKKKKRGYVTLKAYSADRFLTLDKFCQVYTGKSLVNGMIATTLANYGMTVNFKEYCTAVGDVLYMANLQHLKSDAKIPYAVQYNESFYDFLIRMCNRHGEFLYCEENQLHIGLVAEDKISTIEEDGDVEIECSASGWTYANGVETMFSDCLKENGVGGLYKEDEINRPQNQMFVDDSIYPEHYFEKYQKSGEGYEYATRDEFASVFEEVFTTLQTFAERPTLADALVTTGVKKSMAAGIIAVAKDKINDKYNDTYFNKNQVKEETTSYYPFSSPEDGLNGKFYDTILLKEKETEKNKVTVTCSTCQKYKLGDRVKIGMTEHVVYRVKGSAKVLDGALDGTRRYVDSYELLLLPKDGENEKGKYYPLPMPERRIRKASPQRAIVKNPLDPKKMGRVQVVYPWQSVNDTNFSPWLRVAYPMASEEGGFMFVPEIDDEVLVDYEGGNIERPFVAGSFYSGDRKPAAPAQMHLMGTTKSITSPNGHHISFTNPKDNAKFFANLAPGWSLVSKFGEGANVNTEFCKTYGKYLAGGFEIADYFGVYSIKGNTEDRSISINSPLGDITLDAFTGITINAPHGDVKIVGKNVDIEARNNLTITSGTNIENSFIGSTRHGSKSENLKKQILGSLATGLGSVIKTVGLDLSFYRTCLEVVLRPIGGTMLVKSHRYMKLEAGEGETSIIRTRQRLKGDDTAKNIGRFLIRSAFSELDYGGYKGTIETNINLVKTAIKAYNEFINDYTALCQTEFDTLKKEKEKYPTNFKKISHFLVEKKNTVNKVDKYVVECTDTFKNLATVDGDLTKAVDNIKDKINALLEKEYTLNKDHKELINDNDWKELFKKLRDDLIKELYEIDLTSAKSLAPGILLDEFKLKRYALIKIQGLELPKALQATTTKLNYGDIFKFDLNETKSPALLKSIEPIIEKELELSKGWQIGKFILGVSNKALATEGLYDDNAWGKNEKGGIYMSAHKDKFYFMNEDGTLKPGNSEWNSDRVWATERIKELVGNLKLQ